MISEPGSNNTGIWFYDVTIASYPRPTMEKTKSHQLKETVTRITRTKT